MFSVWLHVPARLACATRHPITCPLAGSVLAPARYTAPQACVSQHQLPNWPPRCLPPPAFLLPRGPWAWWAWPHQPGFPGPEEGHWVGRCCLSIWRRRAAPPPTVSHPGDGQVKWALLQTWEECVVVSKHLRSRSGSSWKEPACQGRARPPRPSKAPPSPPRSLGKAQEVDPPAPIICGL